MHMGEHCRLHCTSQLDIVDVDEQVYCVAITFKMTEQVEQRIGMKLCFKLEHSSTKTIWMIQKATAVGNW